MNSAYLSWFPYAVGDSIVFVDSTGKKIVFTVSNLSKSEDYERSCFRGEIGCTCPSCDQTATAYEHGYTTDSSMQIVNTQGMPVRTYNEISVSIDSVERGGYDLGYRIFDLSAGFSISPTFNLLINNDILIDSLTLGNHTYTDVVVHQVDTTATISQNPIFNVYFVWKTYYSKQFGVVGFHDLKTHTLFYRKL